MFLNRLTAQSWVAVWTLMAAPAYVSFEEGGFGPRTWLDVAHLTYCVVVGVGGFIAILAADPLREPDR